MNMPFKNTRLVKGIITLLLGALFLAYPGLTIVSMIKFLGILLIISGVVIIIPQIMDRSRTNRIWVTESIINIVLGIVFLSFPEALASVFVAIIGLLAVFIGIIKFITYIRLREILVKPTLKLIESIYYFLLGILIIVNPFESLQVIVRLIGLLLLVYGIMDLLNLGKKEEAEIIE